MVRLWIVGTWYLKKTKYPAFHEVRSRGRCGYYRGFPYGRRGDESYCLSFIPYFCLAFLYGLSYAMARVIHCILNNLVYEQRLHKLALTLSQAHEVEVVGVVTPRTRSPLSPRPYKVTRLIVPIPRGPLFFLLANIRFVWYLLFRAKWDAVVACDLDILPACWVAARLHRKKVFLDSRELYPHSSFMVGQPFKRRVWALLERMLYPRVGYILTVSPPIARYFERSYKRSVWVIYNLPLRGRGFARPHLENRLLLYQGMLHPHRGLEELILGLSQVRDWKLWIVGDGPLRGYLEELVKQQRLEERVTFFGAVPFEALEGYTQQATFGVSGELPRALNHKYALPNKAFDYLQQGIPLLVGEAPLLQALVRHYGCGKVVESWRPQEIARTLEEISRDVGAYVQWVENARKAAKELHWERQAPCLLEWVRRGLAQEPLPPQWEIPACEGVSALHKIYQQVGD